MNGMASKIEHEDVEGIMRSRAEGVSALRKFGGSIEGYVGRRCSHVLALKFSLRIWSFLSASTLARQNDC